MLCCCMAVIYKRLLPRPIHSSEVSLTSYRCFCLVGRWTYFALTKRPLTVLGRLPDDMPVRFYRMDLQRESYICRTLRLWSLSNIWQLQSETANWASNLGSEVADSISLFFCLFLDPGVPLPWEGIYKLIKIDENVNRFLLQKTNNIGPRLIAHRLIGFSVSLSWKVTKLDIP